MNVGKIIELMQTVPENRLTSLELREGEPKFSLKCEKGMPQTMTVSAPFADAVSTQMAAVQNDLAGPPVMSPAIIPQGAVNPQIARDTTSGVDIDSDKVIASPLVRTFYNASSPDIAPFTQAGDTVKKDQVPGTIEAMRLMNEIKSEYDGAVETALVNNGEVVEHSQPLSRIK